MLCTTGELVAKRVTQWCESGIGHTAPSGTGSITQWPPSAEAGATEVPFQCSPCR